MNVMRCFYKTQGERGYWKRMFSEWLKIYPQSDISEQRIADQKHSIVKNCLLTVLEQDLLKCDGVSAGQVINDQEFSSPVTDLDQTFSQAQIEFSPAEQ